MRAEEQAGPVAGSLGAWRALLRAAPTPRRRQSGVEGRWHWFQLSFLNGQAQVVGMPHGHTLVTYRPHGNVWECWPVVWNRSWNPAPSPAKVMSSGLCLSLSLCTGMGENRTWWGYWQEHRQDKGRETGCMCPILSLFLKTDAAGHGPQPLHFHGHWEIRTQPLWLWPHHSAHR